jgi:hypothetical protein
MVNGEWQHEVGWRAADDNTACDGENANGNTTFDGERGLTAKTQMTTRR